MIMLENLTKLALCIIPRKIMMIFLSKGSAYPDINGGIGILFEQASSRVTINTQKMDY